MGFNISKGKHGTIVCEDDSGVVTIELPADGISQVDRSDIIDIEGGIDISSMDQWLDEMVAAVRAWGTAARL